MKKNLTKKLMLSVLTLAFAVVSLGASTFAWFTTSNKAKVDQISYNVTSDAGLEVAVSKVDGSAISNYYIGTLPQDQIKAVVAGTGFTAFNAVSYYKGVGDDASFSANTFYQHAGYEKVVTPGTDGADDVVSHTPKAGAAATSGYVAFQLNVRVDQDGKIRLLVPYLTSTPDSKSWEAGVKYTDNKGQEVGADEGRTYDVLAASRLAIVPSTNTAIANPALYQAKAVEATTTSVGNTKGLSNKGALEIYNAKYDGKDSDIPEIPAGLTDVFVEVQSGDANAQVLEFNATAGTVYEFEVYIWIEGYDAECANAIFSQALAAKFAFQYAATGQEFAPYDWTK